MADSARVLARRLASLKPDGLWSAATEVAMKVKGALCMVMGMSRGFHEGAVAE